MLFTRSSLGISDREICKALNSVQSFVKITPYKLKKFRAKHGIELSQNQDAEKKNAVTTETYAKEKDDKAKNADHSENSNSSKNSEKFSNFKNSFTKFHKKEDGIVDNNLYITDEEP